MYSSELSQQGRIEFINFWYIMIIINDVMIIIGSAIKEEIERKVKYLIFNQNKQIAHLFISLAFCW
jgi:mucolipin 3